MGLKLKFVVLLDMKVESTTLPCSFLLTYIFELRILIWVRGIPDCIKFHLSFNKIDSIFRCSLDMMGLTEYGLVRLPLFANARDVRHSDKVHKNWSGLGVITFWVKFSKTVTFLDGMDLNGTIKGRKHRHHTSDIRF